MSEQPHITILLATYNGAKFLAEQLQSFAAQTHTNWSLLISDDGSTDVTLEIIQGFITKNPGYKIEFIKGPRTGATANFLSLLCHPKAAGPYFALSDQDDIWFPDKLERALTALKAADPDQPALYGARTVVVDKDMTQTGVSPLFQRPPSFQNALVQNIMGGNTMVMNAPAQRRIAQAGPDVDVTSHDWWLYQLITGTGGTVLYDPEPALYYRQHEANVIGSNSSKSAKLRRIQLLFKRRFAQWNEQNSKTLTQHAAHLTPENQHTLQEFVQLRALRGLKAALMYRKSGIHRQGALGNIALICAAMLGRI